MDQFEAAQHGDLQQLRVALTVDNVNDGDDDGRNDCWTALHWAADNGHNECVKFCIEMGANVNARNNEGTTALHLASWEGHANVVCVLLDTGAIIDATDSDGWTPLYWAIRSKWVNVIHLLVDRGAKLSHVKLDKYVPSIPDWITTFIESRFKCRYAAITIIGIHKYRRTAVTGNNDINVLRLISKHIWSTRMDVAWVIPFEVETKELDEIQNVANN
jgi:ankyrin repeat protein